MMNEYTRRHNRDRAVANGSFGFLWALTLLFIALKLLGVINWSWWVVLLPIELPFAIIATVLGFCFLMAVLTGQIGKR